MEPTGEEEEREAKKQRRRSVEGEMREAGFKAERDGQTSLRTYVTRSPNPPHEVKGFKSVSKRTDFNKCGHNAAILYNRTQVDKIQLLKSWI